MVNYSKIIPTQKKAIQLHRDSSIDMKAIEVIHEMILPRAGSREKVDIGDLPVAKSIEQILKSRGWNVSREGEVISIGNPRTTIERFYRSLPLPSNYDVYWSNWTGLTVLGIIIGGCIAPMSAFGAFPAWVSWLATGSMVLSGFGLIMASANR